MGVVGENGEWDRDHPTNLWYIFDGWSMHGLQVQTSLTANLNVFRHVGVGRPNIVLNYISHRFQLSRSTPCRPTGQIFSFLTKVGLSLFEANP